MHFTADQEARLAQLASHSGIGPEQPVQKASTNLLEDDERFRAAVREGIAAADRGEFVDHEEVWTNIESILRP